MRYEAMFAVDLRVNDTLLQINNFTIQRFMELAVEKVKVKVMHLLGGGMQRQQITVTISNASYSFPAARRRLSTVRRLGVTNVSSATSSLVLAISVQAAFVDVDEAQDAVKLFQAGLPNAADANIVFVSIASYRSSDPLVFSAALWPNSVLRFHTNKP